MPRAQGKRGTDEVDGRVEDLKYSLEPVLVAERSPPAA